MMPILFTTAVSAALHAPHVRAPMPTMAAAATSYEISAVKGDDASIRSAASFFVSGFWEAGTTVSNLELSDAEREMLVSQQADDMQARAQPSLLVHSHAPHSSILHCALALPGRVATASSSASVGCARRS